jgi:hypothetical protein
VLTFLSQAEMSRVATQAAIDALAAAHLIQPWPLAIEQDQQNVPVTGLYRVDEAALNALENEAFLALRPSGALTLAYAQLFSMNQLAVLQKLVQVQTKLNQPAPAPAQGFAGIKGIGLSQDGGSLKFH